MIDLFSYTEGWGCSNKRKQLYNHLRYSYILKSLILLPFLPIDIAYLIVRRLLWGKTKAGYVFISSKALGQCYESVAERSGSVFLIADPFSILRRQNRSIGYFPASPIYLVCAFLPWRGGGRYISNKLIISFTRYLLRLVFQPGRFVLVMHSDALPFARAVLFATRDDHELSSVSVCIQHGLFHEHFECSELDGSLSQINVARSEFDKVLIKKNNRNAVFIVSEDFFLPSVSTLTKGNDSSVILIGEGLHVVDMQLSRKYLSKLKDIEVELIERGWSVKYRPHPSEKMIYHSFGFGQVDGAELSESLATAVAYIGYSSTLLAEASSVGIPCYKVKIEGAAQVNFARGFENSKVRDYEISNFFPQPKSLELSLHSLDRRLTAQKDVISTIEGISHG